MEIDQQVMFRGGLHQVDAIVDVLLRVAREEIDLHACDADALAPGELRLAVFRLVQEVFRARRAVGPSDRGAVPDHRPDPLLQGVGDGVLDGLPVLHPVPARVDQHIRQLQRRGQVHILLDDVVVVGAVVVGPVDPRHHARVNPVGIVQFAEFAEVGDQGRFHHFGQRADDDHAPGRMVGNLAFVGLVRHHAEDFAVVVQAGRALSLFHVGFGDQREEAVDRLRQQRIAPVVAEAFGRARNGAERVNGRDFCGRGQREEPFIGVRPLLHPALRPLRDDIGRRFCARQRFYVTESDAVVVEPQFEGSELVFIGLIPALLPLAGKHPVAVLHKRFMGPGPLQVVRRHGNLQFQDLLSLVMDDAAPLSRGHRDTAVGRRDLGRACR